MLLAVLLSCLFLFAEANCSLRLSLKDSYGDGWNGNSLTLTSGGSPLTLTAVSGLASVNSDGSATLTGGSGGDFQFFVDAGAPVEFNFAYTVYEAENSWQVSLYNAYAPFGAVVLTASTLSSSNVPTSENIGTVICGPIPAAVSNVVATPGVYAQEVTFSWPSVAVNDTTNSVVYSVSARDIADPNSNNWLLLAPPTAQAQLSVVFPPSATYQVQVVAINQYGPGQAFLLTYTVPAYSTSSVWVKLFDSAQNGWGTYDGFIFVTLSAFAYGSLTFPCATGSICTEILYEVKIPVGVAYTAGFTYQAPSNGGSDCSFAIYNANSSSANAIFQSGQNQGGPVVQTYSLTCNYPGTPTKSNSGSGTTPTAITCPGTEPVAGAACNGLTPTGGCAYQSSCCCPDEAIASNQFCVSNTYTCDGSSTAVWQAVVQTPVCVSDPTFTCPSDCPDSAPISQIGSACTAALTCNYLTACGGATGCQRTDTYACTGSASLTWQSSSSCTCSNISTCAPWELLISTGDCCATPPHCVTDQSSTVCLTPSGWTPCAATSGTCGAGTQTQTTYTRQSNGQCLTQTVSQGCTIPCPVACVGSWSNYTTCSVSCGIGTKTRKYTVTTPAANSGTPCPTADGTIDTAQCDTSSACVVPTVCTYVVDAYDAYGDGWDTSYVAITYPGSPANLTFKVPFVDGSTSQHQYETTFQVQKGTQVTFTYNIMQEGYPTECSFAIAAGFTANGVTTKVGPDVLDNPPNLAVGTVPTTVVSFVAACATCTNASPAFCAGLNRVSCDNAQVGDNLCGACVAGYNATVVAKGTTACTDIDECLTPNKCGTGSVCTNLAGSFNCSCAQGYTLFNGACLQGTCPSYRLRKEWNDLTDAEKDRFIRAVVALGPAFWDSARNAHAYAATAPHDVHSDNWFLPWHRGFLNDLEIQLFQLPGDLRCTCLTYWDWTRTSEQGTAAQIQTYIQTKIFTDAKTSTGLWAGFGIKSAANWNADSSHPFKNMNGYRAAYGSFSWTAYGAASIYGGALTQTTYLGLTSFLVNGGHGNIHSWIGGFMGYLNLAGGDPIFYLHHGFLEILHSSWQACKGYTNRDNVPAAAWPTTPHAIGAKMPVCLTNTYSWYDLYSNDILKIKFGSSFITRVSATSASYCPAGTASGLYALLEAPAAYATASYVVGSPVVHNSTTATIITTAPSEEAADSGLSQNKKKKGNKKGKHRVHYNVTKHLKTHVDPQLTADNQAAIDSAQEAADTFKKVLKSTGDVQQALSAAIDVECSRGNYTSALTTSDQMIKDMNMQRMCAQGMCYHQCYLRQQGRNKAAYKSDYQNQVEAGTQKSYKDWKSSQTKKSAKGTAPSKKNNKKKAGKKNAYVEFFELAPTAQF